MDIKTGSCILTQQFRKYWVPGQFLIINESLIAFWGKYKHKQHMPLKPAGTSVKIYVIADETGTFMIFGFIKGQMQNTMQNH